MNLLFTLLSVQAVMGAFDNLWHHELQAKLPQRHSARRELALHTAREAIYGVVFIGLAWWQWQGLFAALLAALLGAEVVITLADFLEEDRTRRLPSFAWPAAAAELDHIRGTANPISSGDTSTFGSSSHRSPTSPAVTAVQTK